MKPVISIGNQDFRSIRENNRFYVDKIGFIKEWWESGELFIWKAEKLSKAGKKGKRFTGNSRRPCPDKREKL